MNSSKLNNETINEVVVEALIINNNEDKIYGKLYAPQKEGKYPAVILSHGFNGCHSDFEKECMYFAQNGFVAYAYDFCGGSTRSKSSRDTVDMTVFTEKEDLIAVLNYIKTLSFVDSDGIYLFGGSQGGLVTTLAAEECRDYIRGIALYFPALNIPDNWRRNFATVEDIPEVHNLWGVNLSRNFFLKIRDFDTFANIGKFDKDVLIIHGDKDDIVLLKNSIKAQSIYNKAKLIVLPQEGHGFSEKAGKEAMEQVLYFMKKHL